MFKVPEKYRDISRAFSDESYGNNGAFAILLRSKGKSRKFTLIASDGDDWEHVSVSLPDRCPTWSEMCFMKDLFWDDTDCVVQYHPPKVDYVNNHPYCLHLWRDMNTEITRPPAVMVGLVGE